MKVAQRDEMKEQQRMKKEGIVPEDADTDLDGPGQEGFGDGDIEGFGEDPSAHMDLD
jgi:transcription initiation factor TFIID subunit 7